jgi:GTPase SAR1 family protein
MKDAKCALIVTDVANKKSFDSANAWYQMYSDNKNPDSFALLLGNKIDLSPR